MKSSVSRRAVVASTLLTGLIVFSATPSNADSSSTSFPQQKQETRQDPVSVMSKFGTADVPSEETVVPTRNRIVEAPKPMLASSAYIATAYSLRGRTASGRMVTRGLIAADPSVLPLGSRVRLDHPGYSGEYLVADTGGAIRGRRIDIWTPSSGEAMRFGRRTVKLTVLSYGARRGKRTR
jgi:3D (Asp-Asp-Asp) domain-containing protein